MATNRLSEPLASSADAERGAPATESTRRISGHGEADIVIEKNIAVSMRDGVELTTEVWRLKDGPPGPALLSRTCYDHDWLATIMHRTAGSPYDLIAEGYALVLQRSRGTGDSGGTYEPFFVETDDGFDTVAWIAQQSWCDGNVGMFGGSYLGGTQWQAAQTAPPALKAIAPAITSADRYDSFYDVGGVQVMGGLTWSYLVGTMRAKRAEV